MEGWAVVGGAGVAGVDGGDGGGAAAVVVVVAAACVQAGVGGEDGVARIGSDDVVAVNKKKWMNFSDEI